MSIRNSLQLKTFALTSVLSLLVGCGGGGGGAGDTATFDNDPIDSGASVPSLNDTPVPTVIPIPDDDTEPVSTTVLSAPIDIQLTALDENQYSASTVSATVSSTRDLIAPDSFDFKTHRSFLLILERNSEDRSQIFVSLCVDFEQVDGEVSAIDYSSCLLKARVNKASYRRQVDIPSDHDRLVATIWFEDNNRAPQHQLFEL